MRWGDERTEHTAHTGTASDKDQNQVVAAHLLKMKGTGHSHPIDEPAHTVQAGGNHAGLVYAFLQKYYGTAVGQPCVEPLHTIPTLERFGLVTVTVDGETYVIVDIAMRMLTPRELALCQGFRPDYIIDRGADGRPLSKRVQVRLIGNSVCRQVARALVRENVVRMNVMWRAAA